MVQLIRENKVFLSIYFLFMLTLSILLYLYNPGDFVVLFSQNRTPFLNQFFQLITMAGEELAYIIVAFVFLFIKFKESIMVSVTGLLVLLIAFLLKWFFSVPRPSILLMQQGRWEDFIPIEGVDMLMGNTGFPSGHTAGGFALMVFIAMYAKNYWIDIACVFLAILVGMSRIYLGHHTLADVAFGSIVGLVLSVFTQSIAMRTNWPQWAESKIDLKKRG